MKVFLAHSSIDKNFVRSLKRDLRSYGYLTWMDEDDMVAGQQIRESIHYGIRESNFFCVILTLNSIRSEWVKYELGTALSSEGSGGSTVIPIVREKCEIPPVLNDIKHVDFTKSYVDGFDQLLRALLFDYRKQHPNQDRTCQRLSLLASARELMRSGVFDMAELYISKAIDLDPQDALPWHQLGGCLYCQGLPANALSAFHNANVLSPMTISILRDYGM
jgi:hypothetical protein